MFSPGHAGASAYARVGVETGVMSANPHRLIAMLYQGARQAIGDAIRIDKSGLQQALNREAGGEITARLDALYSYIWRRLLQASVEASESMLIEVDGLLVMLEGAWTGIGPEVARMAARQAADKAR